MLSEKDRLALNDIERRCAAEDPAFAALLASGRVSATTWRYTVGIVLAALLLVGCLLLALPVAALNSAVLTAGALVLRRMRCGSWLWRTRR